MEYRTARCDEFVEALASKAPVPGGGGASALAGAIGMALGSMVGNLTIGKKKYADVQEDIEQMNAGAQEITQKLLTLIERDAEVFAPLAEAYGMPKDTEEQRAEKSRVMERALLDACSVPMEIMEQCCLSIELHEKYAQKGSAMAISDVGVGVALCRAALAGASFNVFINTKAMTDREKADEINGKAEELLARYVPIADAIANAVRGKLV